jgi:hypothetical protein
VRPSAKTVTSRSSRAWGRAKTLKVGQQAVFSVEPEGRLTRRALRQRQKGELADIPSKTVLIYCAGRKRQGPLPGST